MKLIRSFIGHRLYASDIPDMVEVAVSTGLGMHFFSALSGSNLSNGLISPRDYRALTCRRNFISRVVTGAGAVGGNVQYENKKVHDTYDA